MAEALTAAMPRDTNRIVVAIILTIASVALLLALASYHPAQISGAGSAPTNLIGGFGAHLAHYLVEAWGAVAFYPSLLGLGYAIALLRGKQLDSLAMRLTGAILLLPVLAALIHLIGSNAARDALLMRWDQVHYHGLGDRLGWQLMVPAGTPEALQLVEGTSYDHPGGLLRRYLGTSASAFVLIAAMIGCVSLMRIGVIGYARRIINALQQNRRKRPTGNFADQPKEPIVVPEPTPLDNPTDDDDEGSTYERTASSIEEVTRKIASRESTTSLDAKDLVERIRARRRALETGNGDDDADDDLDEPTPRVASAPALPPRRATPEPPPREDTPAPLPPIAGANQAASSKPKPKPRRPRAASEDYALPGIEVLEDTPNRDNSKHEAETAQTAREIEDLFKEFRINVRVVAASRGPVITQYELELLDAGVKVNKVEGFDKDLALKLGTEGIRIVAPLPNKKTIGVEVPNRLKQAVVMRELVEQVDSDEYSLPLILGRDVLGGAMVGDLATMPHLLIAGATGMGKSVCLNAIITSMLLYRSPSEVKFIMVDPKMVELAGYEGIPHLLTRPITDMSQAHAALEWACKTMDERFFALRMVGVRDIISYNKLGEDEIRKRLARKDKTLEELNLEVTMPWIVIIVDEWADLMMVNKEVEKSIIRLCAKSRACGIHVILATQRPSADVVTGLIKSNLPSRICFRVADRSNSRVVLDSGGAENLLGRGDMLYMPPGSSNLVRGQGVWVRDEEIDAIIEHAREQGEPEYDDSIFAIGAAALSGGGGGVNDDDSDKWLQDRQFHEAVWCIYRYNKTGADFLRRKLSIGYNKATKWVEWLEDLGILSTTTGSRPREILKPFQDWLDLLKEGGISWTEEDEIYTDPLR